MEPLQKAITVIEKVTEEIVLSLGEAARPLLDPDRLFTRAEYHIGNDSSVEAATNEILADVLPDTEKALKEKLSTESDSKIESNDGKKDQSSYNPFTSRMGKGSKPSSHKENDRSNSGASTSGIFVQSDKQNSPSSFSRIEQNSSLTSRTSEQNGPSAASTSKQDSLFPFNSFTEKDSSNGSGLEQNRHSMFGGFREEKESSSSQEKESFKEGVSEPSNQSSNYANAIGSPEISILSPPPKKPAPLIDLCDDSLSDASTCNSDIVVVRELENKRLGEKQPAKVESLPAPKSSYCNKTHDELMKFEAILSEMGVSEASSSKEVLVDLEVDISSGDNEGIKSNNKYEKTFENDLVDDIESDDGGSHRTTNESKSGASHNGNTKASTSASTSVETVKDDSVSLNKTEAVGQNGDVDFYDDNSPGENDPTEIMWKDAQYICSLLPYFELADVQQTMVDNYFHPNRKAHVLEAYIELALDRGEIIPDNVISSLKAAKKRSHVEACGNQPASGKRQKVDPSVRPKTSGANNSLNNSESAVAVTNDPVPSTSGVVAPNAVNIYNDPVAGPHTNFTNKDQPGPPVGQMGEKWYNEKMNFISAVVPHIDRRYVREQLDYCSNDADVEALLLRLMETPNGPDEAGQPLEIPNQPLGVPANASGAQNHQISAFKAVDRSTSNAVPHGDTIANDIPGTSGLARGSNEGLSGDNEELPSADAEDSITALTVRLSEIFNDADPDYLRDRVVGISGRQEEFTGLVEELMEKKEYPKMEEYLKRQKRLEIKKKFIEGMSVEDFLGYFEDPEKVFSDTEKKMSATYMENTRRQLSRDLPYHLSKDIDNELRKNNYHYLPTLRAIEANKKLSRRKTKRAAVMKESDLDDIFIKELCYARMQVEIKEYLLEKEQKKRMAFLWAKTNNELKECGCCYDDEVLEEDMDSCNSEETKHKFCNNCIRRFAEEEIGQGRISFRCLDGDCKAEFSLNTLKKLMKPSVFSNILQRKQLEEIAAAGIEDLESCPFCNFQTIMPNQEDKVFKCLNPECMKDSCRLCKEPNHVPLRCEEVEKQNQKDARTFLENKMTEAMVRECWRCKKRFIKADGCNKMRCSCGAMMCYICKKPIKGYDHFEDNPFPINKNKCPLWSNSETIHAEEVRDAAKRLKDDLDPGIELKHDPTKDLPEVPKHLEQRAHYPIPPEPYQVHQNPPPAHQRRHPHHHHRERVLYWNRQFAQHYHHHHHRHHHRHVLDGAFGAPNQGPDHLLYGAGPPQPPPQPAHQHPPIQLVINNGRNNYHHHHHHHFHVAGQQGVDDPRRLAEQLNEFDEVFRNVRLDHQQQQIHQHPNHPLPNNLNQARFQQRADHQLPLQRNLQNLPHEHAHNNFLGGL